MSWFRKNREEDNGILVAMSSVKLPLDLMLELVLRQQQQLFTNVNMLTGSIGATDSVVEQMAETLKHLHDDLLEFRQEFESAKMHPVERVDAVTEMKEHEESAKKKKLN